MKTLLRIVMYPVFCAEWLSTKFDSWLTRRKLRQCDEKLRRLDEKDTRRVRRYPGA